MHYQQNHFLKYRNQGFSQAHKPHVKERHAFTVHVQPGDKSVQTRPPIPNIVK